jgi:hypothetical protein
VGEPSRKWAAIGQESRRFRNGIVGRAADPLVEQMIDDELLSKMNPITQGLPESA